MLSKVEVALSFGVLNSILRRFHTSKSAVVDTRIFSCVAVKVKALRRLRRRLAWNTFGDACAHLRSLGIKHPDKISDPGCLFPSPFPWIGLILPTHLTWCAATVNIVTDPFSGTINDTTASGLLTRHIHAGFDDRNMGVQVKGRTG